MISVDYLPNQMLVFSDNTQNFSIFYESDKPVAIDFGSSMLVSDKTKSNKLDRIIHTPSLAKIPHDEMERVLDTISS